jgi:hypothetical protein
MRALLPLLLLSCDAEDLGVRLPQGGTDAVDAAEIRQVLWTLTDPRLGGRAPGSSGARRSAEAIAERLEAAHLRPGFAEGYRKDLGMDRGEMVCGVAPGDGGGAQVVLALDPGVGSLSAVPIAGLTALASAFDGPELAAPHVFCVLPEAGGLDGYAQHPPHPLSRTAGVAILGSLTGTQLQRAPGPEIVGLRTEILHTGPLSKDLGQDMSTVDVAQVATQVRAVYLQLGAAGPEG